MSAQRRSVRAPIIGMLAISLLLLAELGIEASARGLGGGAPGGGRGVSFGHGFGGANFGHGSPGSYLLRINSGVGCRNDGFSSPPKAKPWPSTEP